MNTKVKCTKNVFTNIVFYILTYTCDNCKKEESTEVAPVNSSFTIDPVNHRPMGWRCSYSPQKPILCPECNKKMVR